MKKCFGLVFLVIALITTLLFSSTASANSWNLKGKLLSAVIKTHDWDDYTLLGNQADPFAVMKARYHQAMFFVDNRDKLHVYTTAVYQPDDKREAPSLMMMDQNLYLSYGNDEQYVFRPGTEDGEYLLYSATIRNFQLLSNWENEADGPFSYWANERGSTALWQSKIRLSDFNIKLLPHSVAEVHAMNLMHAQFDSSLQCLGFVEGSGDIYNVDHPGKLLKVGKKKTAPVYSAPYGKSAWRAGNGKAAVGLNGDIWMLSQYRNEEGQSYACIRYNVSERTQRIGYALCKDLGLPEITDWHPDEPITGFAHVDVEATADTWLTDDPDVSQYSQFQVPKGTQFSCMGLYNDYYAYVGAEVKNDRFVYGGAIIWGFVPVRNLKPIEQEKQPEAMSRLVGKWKMEAGGSMADDYLVFNSDGTFTAGMWNWDLDTLERVKIAARDSGTWYVTKYNPFMNLYWNKPPFQLTLIYDNGQVKIRGLNFVDEGFSLTNAEGGGGYIPAAEDDVQLTEDQG
ncbi:MAG: hypothetical protein IJ242_03155 [Clostridia bacterium]|nr:hypothetical protein [Clostridia bacterium]